MRRPCPFCGCDKLRLLTLDSQATVVSCEHCQATGPTAGNTHDARQYWDSRETPEIGWLFSRLLKLRDRYAACKTDALGLLARGAEQESQYPQVTLAKLKTRLSMYNELLATCEWLMSKKRPWHPDKYKTHQPAETKEESHEHASTT